MLYTDQSGDLELYEEQLSRWKKLELDSGQRREVERLAERIPQHQRPDQGHPGTR